MFELISCVPPSGPFEKGMTHMMRFKDTTVLTFFGTIGYYMSKYIHYLSLNVCSGNGRTKFMLNAKYFKL